MVNSHFDTWTTILYILIGIIGYNLIKKMMRKNISQLGGYSFSIEKTRKDYMIAFIIFYALFAAVRHVGYCIGGTDAQNYIEMFQYCLNYDVANRGGNTTIEPGFIAVTKAIRYFSDSWRIYFFVVYGFIAFSYVYFIRKMCPKAMVFIPMVLLAFLYVKGFNTLRSHMAISVFLIGLTFIKDKKWLSFFIIVSSMFFHRMSILYVPIYFFYFLVKKYMVNMDKWFFLIIGIIGLICSYVVGKYLQNYIFAIGLLGSTTDMTYVTRSMGTNILESYPMYFAHIALFMALFFFYEKVDNLEEGKMMKILFIYDLWMVPAALILGMWRFPNYLYVLRLCLWSIILYYLCKGKYAPLYKIMAWVVFIFWFVFRFSREWDDTGTSPYIFGLFNI